MFLTREEDKRFEFVLVVVAKVLNLLLFTVVVVAIVVVVIIVLLILNVCCVLSRACVYVFCVNYGYPLLFILFYF